jgi:tripartite-type tricarboxylate transporter receptor subunit TctC
MKRTVAVVTLLLAAVAAHPVAADTYPSKPIRMLVGFPPGGGTDIMARLIGAKLTESWGQQVIVDNKGGAAGTIAAAEAARASPDGYTLLMGHVNSNAIAPSSIAPRLSEAPLQRREGLRSRDTGCGGP